MASTLVMTLGLLANKKTQWERYAKHPLAHGLMGQDIIHQQGGTVGHASCSTAGTKAASFAAESDQFLIVTGFTLDSEKTVVQTNTGSIRLWS